MDLEIGAGEVLVVSSTFTQMESGDQALSAKGGVGLGMPITGGADVQSTIVVGFNIFDIFAV